MPLDSREFRQVFIALTATEGLNIAGHGYMIPLVHALRLIAEFAEPRMIVTVEGNNYRATKSPDPEAKGGGK